MLAKNIAFKNQCCTFWGSRYLRVTVCVLKYCFNIILRDEDNNSYAPFTWKEDDPSARIILEGFVWFTCKTWKEDDPSGYTDYALVNFINNARNG